MRQLLRRLFVAIEKVEHGYFGFTPCFVGGVSFPGGVVVAAGGVGSGADRLK